MVVVIIRRVGLVRQFITYIFTDTHAINLLRRGQAILGAMEQGIAPTLHVRYPPQHSAIMQFGKDWRKVEQYVRTRTSSQVRSHAQKFFNKLQKAP